MSLLRKVIFERKLSKLYKFIQNEFSYYVVS